jgi:hypothetical protein
MLHNVFLTSYTIFKKKKWFHSACSHKCLLMEHGSLGETLTAPLDPTPANPTQESPGLPKDKQGKNLFQV